MVPGGQATFEAVFFRMYPERVTRGSPSGGYAVGPITGIDASMLNLLGARTESWDYSVGYVRSFTPGSLDIAFRATYLKDLSIQYAPGRPREQLAGIVDYEYALGIRPSGGAKKKGYLSLSWNTASWQAGWRVRHIDEYYAHLDRMPIPGRSSATIPSQTYHDVFVRYTVGNRTQIGLNLNNVFDRAPPVDLQFGGYSNFGDPRQANYDLVISYQF